MKATEICEEVMSKQAVGNERWRSGYVHQNAVNFHESQNLIQEERIMKKVLVMVFMLVAFGLVGSVYAQTMDGHAYQPFYDALTKAKEMTAEGTVVSHDLACHCIVLQTSSGNMTFQDDYAQFNQDYNRVKGLKIGAKAKITYKTVEYINYATRVEQ